MERREIEKYGDKHLEKLSDNKRDGIVWKAFGGIALLGLAALVVVSLPDIKRYIKISSM